MKTKLGLALLGAIVFHAALLSAVALWPQNPAPASGADFEVVTAPLVTDDLESFGPFGSDICSVHGVKMRVAEVPIIYGLLWEISDPVAYQNAHPEEASHAIRRSRFPNAQGWAWGGCVNPAVFLDGLFANRQVLIDEERVYLCKECELAEEAWRRDHAR